LDEEADVMRANDNERGNPLLHEIASSSFGILAMTDYYDVRKLI